MLSRNCRNKVITRVQRLVVQVQHSNGVIMRKKCDKRHSTYNTGWFERKGWDFIQNGGWVEALLAFCNRHKPCGIWRRERNLLNTSAVTPTVDSRTTERKTQHSSDWEQSCDTEDDRGRKAIGQSSNSVGRSKTLDSAPTTRNKESGTITEKKTKKKTSLSTISIANFYSWTV